MTCPNCNGKVSKVLGVEPYTTDHLQCESCDSTYNEEETMTTTLTSQQWQQQAKA